MQYKTTMRFPSAISIHRLICTVLLCLGSSFATSAVSPEQAATLGRELTPLGAITAGNRAGTIPRWQPDQAEPADEKPLFVITGQNYQKYANQLTDGQKGLFKAYPDTFRMPVYRSRRDFAPPQRVQDQTRANATQVKLTDDGYGIDGGYGGIPFPIPQVGHEAMWNHLLHWRGNSGTRIAQETVVEASGAYTLVQSRQDVLSNYYASKYLDKVDNLAYSYQSFFLAPASIAGGALLLIDSLNQARNPRQTWGYNAGERRVRRIPHVGHDSPALLAQSIRTADDTDMFNGALDRYDWELLGRREIYIPYHNAQLANPTLDLKKVLTPFHLNPDLTRYELHRVWVVRGTLRPNAKHVYSKRDFYLDEDSWSITIADQYDQQGKLWRISLAFLTEFTEEEPVLFPAAEAFHDLPSRRYHVQGLPSGNGTPVYRSQKEPLPQRYFTPQSLREQGIR